MSTLWTEFRTGVVVADLATTDTDIEATQVVAVGGPAFAIPETFRRHSSEMVTEIGIVVLAADGAGAPVAGTCTVQVIEESMDPTSVPTAQPGKIYIGRAPVALHPFGRMLAFDARYIHKFTVRLSAASAGTTLRVLWRPVDSKR